jgi:hypothetical protein
VAPVLLIAEDAQWFDHSTSEVLAFVARRVSADPILLLFAVRDGIEMPSRLGHGILSSWTTVPRATVLSGL